MSMNVILLGLQFSNKLCVKRWKLLVGPRRLIKVIMYGVLRNQLGL